jgi:hypothetical protein
MKWHNKLFLLLIIGIPLVAVLFVYLPISDNVESSVLNRVLEFLEDVVGIEVSKYDAQLLGTLVTYPDWLDGFPQRTGKITLDSEINKLDVIFKLRNNTLSWCLVRQIEGTMQYIDSPSVNMHDAVDGFLERYQTYSKNSEIQHMRNILNTVDFTENITIIEGSMKLTASINLFSVSVDFRNTFEGTNNAVVVSFHNGHFYAFSDNTQEINHPI